MDNPTTWRPWTSIILLQRHAHRMSVEGTGIDSSGSDEAMTSNNHGLKKRAHALMANHPGMKYTEAVRLTRTNVTLGYGKTPPYRDITASPFGNVILLGGDMPGATTLMRHIISEALTADTPWDVHVTSTKHVREYDDLARKGASLAGDPRAVLTELGPGAPSRPKLVLIDHAIDLLAPRASEIVEEHPWYQNLRRLMRDPYTAVISRVTRFTSTYETAAQDVFDLSDTVVVLGNQSSRDVERYLGSAPTPARRWRILDEDATTWGAINRFQGSLLVKSTGRRATFNLLPSVRDAYRNHPFVPVGVNRDEETLLVDATRNIFITGAPGAGATVTCDVLTNAALNQGWRVDAVFDRWFFHDPLNVALADTHWAEGAAVTRFDGRAQGLLTIDPDTGERTVTWSDGRGERASKNLHDWVVSTRDNYQVVCCQDYTHSVAVAQMAEAILTLTPGTFTEPKMIVVDDFSVFLDEDSALREALHGALAHLHELAADANTALIVRAVVPDELPRTLVEALDVNIAVGRPHPQDIPDDARDYYRRPKTGLAYVRGDHDSPYFVPLHGFAEEV